MKWEGAAIPTVGSYLDYLGGPPGGGGHAARSQVEVTTSVQIEEHDQASPSPLTSPAPFPLPFPLRSLPSFIRSFTQYPSLRCSDTGAQASFFPLATSASLRCRALGSVAASVGGLPLLPQVMAAPAADANVAHLGPPAKFHASAPQSEARRDLVSDDAQTSFPLSNFLPSSSHSSSSPSGNLDEEASLPLELRDNGPMDGRLVARVANGPMTRKKMDEEAIAGIVVGVVLGVALLVCCLYPVVVHRIKKYRRSRLSFDCEGGNFRGNPQIRTRRLSSSDSFKRNESPCDDSGRPRDHNSHDAYGNPISGPQGHGAQPSTPGYVDASLDQNLAIEPVTSYDATYYSNPFPLCQGETFPAGTLAPHQVVLKGTSEDYYSPYIPSEAFGMYPTPEPNPGIPKPERTISRGSSLRYNVKQLFRRKSTRDNTMNSHASASQSHDHHGDMLPHLPEATPMPQFFPHHEASESPIEMTDAAELPFSTRARGSVAGIPPEPARGDPEAGSSQSPYSEGLFSHPSQPAPGTVNPMDIMPASTESEVWHRTDYQLHTTTSYESPPHRSSSTEHAQMQYIPATATPSPPQFQHPPPPPAASAPLTHPSQTTVPVRTGQPAPKKEPTKNIESSSQGDASLKAPRGPVPLPTRPSNAVNQTELSTPAQGTSTTTQSTPSTQVDSPSPESLNSSDYCQSASPHALGIPSPRGGVYCCDEPGCNQVFDQPHKLK